MKFPGSSHARRRGFTLIELMIVIILIGIVTALIIPEMRGTYEEVLLRSTSRELVSVLNLASSRAVSLNQLHRVRLDPKSGRYLIERQAGQEERGRGFVPVRDVPGSRGELDPRIVIEIRKSTGDSPAEPGVGSSPDGEPDRPRPDGGDTIAFYSDGTADASEVRLRDRDGFRLALRINPVTARVRLVELPRQ